MYLVAARERIIKLPVRGGTTVRRTQLSLKQHVDVAAEREQAAHVHGEDRQLRPDERQRIDVGAVVHQSYVVLNRYQPSIQPSTSGPRLILIAVPPVSTLTMGIKSTKQISSRCTRAAIFHPRCLSVRTPIGYRMP